MDLSATTQQLSTSRCEGTPFSVAKQQIIGKSCALTTAASVTATGERRDLGTEVFWAWEWSGDTAHTGDGEGARREPGPAAHGAAPECFCGEKSGMVLLLLRGSPELEFGDELGSWAAVPFMEVNPAWPQLSTDVGGAGHPPPHPTPPHPIEVSVPRSPHRHILYPSKASNLSLSPRPSIPPRSPPWPPTGS